MAQFKTQKFTFFAPKTVIFCKKVEDAGTKYHIYSYKFRNNSNIINHHT